MLRLHAAGVPARFWCGITLARPDGAASAPVCSFHDADDARAVSAPALARDLGVPVQRLKFQRQVHGKVVRRVEAHSDEAESDALICNEPDLVLCVRLADCGGVVLFDAAHDALAAVHSGWRGTQLDIVAATVRAMTAEFGTSPHDLRAFVAPCASVERYEVGEEFAGWFPRHVTRLGGRLHFDNQAALRDQLLACGVPGAAISMSNLCTIADPRFHSHRRNGADAGRNCLWAVLRRDAT